MHFFLDTTLLYNDPFLRGNYTRKMVQVAREFDGMIYISPVVIEETRAKIRKQVTENIKAIHKANTELRKFARSEDVVVIVSLSADLSVSEFDAYIGELESEGILTVLDYDGDMLPELVERAIKREKPFSEGKNEFRDATTWLLYAKAAEEQELDDCFFITDNVTDFYDETKKSLHPDLEQDSKRIKLYRNVKEMFDEEVQLRELVTTVEFIQIAESELTEEKVEILLEMQFDAIYEAVTGYAENLTLDQVYSQYYMGGFVQVYGMSIAALNSFSVEEMEHEIIVSGAVRVDLDCTAHIYNPFREPGDEHYFERSLELQVDIDFSFVYTKERETENFETHKFHLRPFIDEEWDVEN